MHLKCWSLVSLMTDVIMQMLNCQEICDIYIPWGELATIFERQTNYWDYYRIISNALQGVLATMDSFFYSHLFPFIHSFIHLTTDIINNCNGAPSNWICVAPINGCLQTQYNYHFYCIYRSTAGKNIFSKQTLPPSGEHQRTRRSLWPSETVATSWFALQCISVTIIPNSNPREHQTTTPQNNQSSIGDVTIR